MTGLRNSAVTLMVGIVLYFAAIGISLVLPFGPAEFVYAAMAAFLGLVFGRWRGMVGVPVVFLSGTFVLVAWWSLGYLVTGDPSLVLDDARSVLFVLAPLIAAIVAFLAAKAQ